MNAKILKEITVLPIETKVKFGDEDETLFKGKITATIIRKHTISYEISFWKDAEIKTIWLPEEDFKCLKNTGRTGIGFAEA
jgi:hypothetical protein